MVPGSNIGLALAGLVAIGLTLGACVVSYPNCNNDNDCRSHHEVCVNSHCQQCRTNAECPPDHTCLHNRCVAGANACDTDADCPAGQPCVDHHCAECSANHACPSGVPCVAGRCQPSSAPPDDDAADNHGRLCTFTAIQFAYDNAQLDDGARRALQTAADCLTREGTTRYTLIGRADARGTTEYNFALGERRARIVQHYLMSLGVTETRIPASSEGSEGATGNDEASWAHDRRVDFRPLN